MKNCIGVILNENLDKNFGSLCNQRPSYMLPYAGRYRILDFALSNIVSYDIRNVVLYTSEKMRSAMDHIGSGRPWGLNRRFSGLRLFSPYYRDGQATRSEQITQLFNTIKFFEDAKEEYVFLMQPSVIAKVNLDDAFEEFVASDADVSLVYKKQEDPHGRYVHFDKLHLNPDGSFKEIGLNLGIDKEFNHFLGMGFIKKDVLITMVKKLKEKKQVSSLKEAISQNKEHFNIVTYEFKDTVQVIKDTESYFKASMELLDEDLYREIFFDDGIILTKSKDEPPTIYKEDSMVCNSLVANGCVIEGTVENSIIFRGVRVEKGAIVKNSIIMQKSVIGKDAIVMNSIFDKSCKIDEGLRVSGSSNIPYVLAKNGHVKKE